MIMWCVSSDRGHVGVSITSFLSMLMEENCLTELVCSNFNYM